jgi:hypothetical protein
MPKNYETKRNFTFDETKRNEMKRNFVVYFVSQNKRNFAKQFFVSLCFVFRETKKRMRNGNPNWKQETTVMVHTVHGNQTMLHINNQSWAPPLQVAVFRYSLLSE